MVKNDNRRYLVLFLSLVGILFVVLALDGCGSKTAANTSSQQTASQQQPKTTGTSQGTTQAPATASTPSVTPATTPTTPQTSQTTTPKSTASTPSTASSAPQKTTPAPSTPAVVPTAVSSGQTLYATQCESCHGNTAAGGNGGPSLRGTPAKYGSQAALAGYIQTNMPQTNPHSLTTAQADNLAAYLFSLK